MNRKVFLLSILTIFLISLFAMLITSCSKEKLSPGEVVKHLVTAIYNEKVSEVKKHASTELLNELKEEGGVKKVVKEAADEARQRGGFEKVEILEENIEHTNGEQVEAEVEFKVYFKNGESESNSTTLIKEKGVWKVKKG